MDTLVCIQPGELAVERRPTPTRGSGEVLARPLRVGICGTDYHIYEGKHPFLQYPRVMGHELAVEVVEAEPSSGFQAGEICVVNPYLSCGTCVACRANKPNCCVRIAVLGVHRDGGMTGCLSLPPENLIRAQGLTKDECAAVEFLAIGAHAVRRAGVSAGDRALVIGAGPIGLGVALLATVSGAKVTILDVDAGRLAAAQSLVARVRTTGGSDTLPSDEDYDIVFDATGNARSMEQGFRYVAHGGRYVLVSVVKGPITFEDPDFHRKEMTLLGSRNATAIDFERVIECIRKRLIPVDRLITHRTTLAGAQIDLPKWATNKHGLVKAMIVLD